jgi:hypothetical protein
MENLHKQNVGLDSSSKFDSYKTPRITQDYNKRITQDYNNSIIIVVIKLIKLT